jgi:hypothetical protein
LNRYGLRVDFDPRRKFCAIGAGLFRAPPKCTLIVANISGGAP